MKWGGSQDAALYQLLNVLLHNRTSDPSFNAGDKGLIWINSSGQVRFNNGAALDTLRRASTKIVTGDFDAATLALSVLATDPLARANHTGTQLAATISDFNAAVRSGSRIDQLLAAGADVDFGGFKGVNVADPTAAGHIVNKAYADNLRAGLTAKDPVRVSVGTNVNIASPGATLDGTTMANGDRVLLTGNSTGSQNGPWVWNGASTPMTRPTDFDVSSEASPGSSFWVNEGTLRGDTKWVLTTNAPITLGTTSLTFVQDGASVSYTAGNGLELVGSVFAVLLDGSTLARSASGLKIATSGVTSNELANGAVDLSTAKVTGTLPISKGGTNATTAAAARAALGVPGRYSTTIGNASATDITVTHNLGLSNKDEYTIRVSLVADGKQELVDNYGIDANSCMVQFGTAPATGAYRVTVVG